MKEEYKWSDEDQTSLDSVLKQITPGLSAVQKRIVALIRERPRTTYELLEELAKESPKISKGSLRQDFFRLREQVESFYAAPQGICQRLRLLIPERLNGISRMEIEPNLPQPNHVGFWTAHLSNGLPTKIVIPQIDVPKRDILPYRDRFGNVRVRKEFLPQDVLADPEANGKPYISVSDVHAMLHIHGFFDQQNRELMQPAPELATELDYQNGSGSNLVALGTPFENELIAELEFSEERLDGCLFFLKGGKFFRKSSNEGEYKCWVTRRWPVPHYETLIQASHPTVLRKVCETLTSERKMREIISGIWAQGEWKGFPPEFRLEFLLTLSDDEKIVNSMTVGRYTEMAGWARCGSGPRYYIRGGGSIGGAPISTKWTPQW